MSKDTSNDELEEIEHVISAKRSFNARNDKKGKVFDLEMEF